MKLVEEPEGQRHYELTIDETACYGLADTFQYMVLVSWSHLPPWSVRKHYNREADEMERWVTENIPKNDWTIIFMQVRCKVFHFKHQSHVMLFKLRFG